MNNLNVEELYEGKIFKNYKELCEFFNWKKYKGNAKLAQFKELNRYCEYAKEGHKIIIVKLHESVKDKEDKRIGNSYGDIYGNMVQLLILNYLNGKKEKSIVISKTNLLQQVGLTNRNYVTLKNYPHNLANYIDFNVIYVYDFYNINDSKLKRITERALNNLEKKRLIFCQNVIKIKKLHEVNSRIANSLEKSMILETERKYLKLNNENDVYKIRVSNKWKKFKSEVSRELLDEFNIEYYYYAYDITINQKYISEEKENLEESIFNVLINSEFDKDENLEKVNNLIIENIKNDTVKRNNNLEKYYFSKNYRLQEDYLTSTDKLCRILIKSDTKTMIYDVLNSKQKNNDIDNELPYGIFPE